MKKKVMTNRENFIRAIKFGKPERVPINGGYCIPRYDKQSDCKPIHCGLSDGDWGYGFTRLDSDSVTMGQVTDHPLKTEDDIQNWRAPELKSEYRFKGVPEQIQRYIDTDLFVFGGMGSYVFERLHYLVGMEGLFGLIYDDIDLVRELGGKIVDFQCEIIREYKKEPCKAVEIPAEVPTPTSVAKEVPDKIQIPDKEESPPLPLI